MQEDKLASEVPVLCNDTGNLIVENDVAGSQSKESDSSIVVVCNGIFNFSRLPRVIFLSILKFFKTTELCQLCLVNKLWRTVCQDASLWRYLDLTKCNNISDEALGRITTLSSNVVGLKINRPHCLTDSGVSYAVKNCSSVTNLSLTCCELSDQVLEAVGQYCHSLKKLDISWSSNFSDDGLSKVCQGCLEMEELVVDQCPKLTSDSLVSLGKHCSKLKSLSTERIANITDNGLISLVQGCPNLKTLRFPFCGLTNNCIAYITRCCPDVLWLDLRGISLGDGDVCSLVRYCSKLEYLNLSLCYNLTDQTALEISTKCNSLKYLFLVHSRITDQGLFLLGNHCTNLEHLDVSWCSAVTENGARTVLKGCPRLKHLGLVRCDHVPESSVDELGLYFPNVFLSTVRTEMKKFLSKEGEQNNSITNCEVE